MNYATIKPLDVANGTGIRVSLFVSGCRNHCKGCFNPETWRFDYGKPFGNKTMGEIFDLLKPKYIAGLSILGGDPFEPENEQALIPFLQRVRALFPDKDIWCYTGYLYENLKDRPMMNYIDVLVDGSFILELKNPSLKFRGSENQRIIYLNEVKK